MTKREKKPVHKVVMTAGKHQIIHQLLPGDDIETAEDIQEAHKDFLGGTIKEMMEVEMDEYLGYGDGGADIFLGCLNSNSYLTASII